MTRHRRLLVVCALLVATRASAAPTPRDAYVAALAREQTVRMTLAAADPVPAVARDARAVVGAYQALVRQFPTSGYADNALWQGGRLSLDLFVRFHDAQDRESGLRLLRSLAATYPTSKLVKQIPDQIARATAVRTIAPAAAPARPSATTQPSSVHKLATLNAIRRTIIADTVRITLEFDGEVSFRDERLANPLRVFVDLPLTQPAAALLDRTLRFDGDAYVVRQVRVGRQPNDATRIVVDATGLSTYSIYPLYSPFRLVIDCVQKPEPRLAVAPLASRTLSLPVGYRLPSASPRWTSTIAAAVTLGRTPAPLPSRLEWSDWGRLLPAASSRGATLIAEALIADVPPRLVARRIRSDWGRALPWTAPGATTLIVEALSVPAPTATPEPRLARRIIRTDWGRALPSTGSRASGLIAAAMADVPPSPLADAHIPLAEGVVATTDAAPSTPRRLTGGYSLARQLGLRVSRVVIDPGHGGHDPGAQGKSVDEAGLVLDVALRVEKLLLADQGTEVILTRRTDEFVPLAERTAIANRESADLFLSIHANASDSLTARGVETYFLNFADDKSAASVAARENAASGQSMAALPDLVKLIALNNKLDESRDFAGEVQRALVDRLRVTNKTVRDLGVKQAPFAVLIGAAMPSVLAEISFVTNAQEEKLLRSNAYRQRIADALYSAVRSYQLSLTSAKSRGASLNAAE